MRMREEQRDIIERLWHKASQVVLLLTYRFFLRFTVIMNSEFNNSNTYEAEKIENANNLKIGIRQWFSSSAHVTISKGETKRYPVDLCLKKCSH